MLQTQIPRILVFGISFLLFLSSYGFQNDLEEALQNADRLKGTNEDSLEYYVNKVISQTKATDPLHKRARLLKIESLILFNHMEEADSLIATMEITPEATKTYAHYLLALGKLENNKGNSDKALELYYESLSVCKEISYQDIIPKIYMEIGIVLRKNNDVENTTKYFRYALKEGEKANNTSVQIEACNLLCKSYNGWLIVDLDSSIYYGEKAISIANEASDKRGYAESIAMVAAPIIRNGDLERGLRLSKEALGYADQYNFPLITRYYLLGNIAFVFEGQQQYDSALYYMRMAGNLRPQSLDQPRLEYRVFKALKNYKKALSALEIYHQKSDSTQRNRNKTKLSSLQARLEANLKEQEVTSLTQKAELQELQLLQQRYLFIGAVIITVILIGIIVLLFRQRQMRQKQVITNLELEETQKRLEMEQQYRASELKALRSQMNPHFVFNALNSIQDYIMSNERKLAGKYLGKFADLMRIYLEHSQVKMITIKEELEALELYLDLEKLRFEDTLKYEVQVAPEVDEEQLIPSLLLQPYVENAIKHGLLHKSDNRELTITVKMDPSGQVLHCSVLDNGVGRAKSREINAMRNPDHKSFATKATRSRLELLNHDRSQPIVEKIEDLIDEHGKATGTEVTIEIPIPTPLEVESHFSESK